MLDAAGWKCVDAGSEKCEIEYKNERSFFGPNSGGTHLSQFSIETVRHTHTHSTHTNYVSEHE